jgi:hypothetical protein
VKYEWSGARLPREATCSRKGQIILANAFVAEEASGKHHLVSAADKPDIEGLVAGRQ